MKKSRKKYRNAIQTFLSRNEDRFIPGPQINKKVDECSVREFLNETMTCNDFQTSLVAVVNKLGDGALKQTTTRWPAIVTCGFSMIL